MIILYALTKAIRNNNKTKILTVILQMFRLVETQRKSFEKKEFSFLLVKIVLQKFLFVFPYNSLPF